MRSENWELKIENLIEVNLKLRREHQIIEYQIIKHAVSRRSITIDKL
jgi:hypothetical protein